MLRWWRGADALALTIDSDEFTLNGAQRSLLEPARLTSGVTIDPATYPKNFRAFVPVLAEQIVQYNEMAQLLWPGIRNDLSVIFHDTHEDILWYFAPNGDYNELAHTHGAV
ncbi:MAG: hypothetical protein LBE35_10960 [Clostridiales bacterium]|nr:hypothetical protein [Clostridiales bacterium]